MTHLTASVLVYTPVCGSPGYLIDAEMPSKYQMMQISACVSRPLLKLERYALYRFGIFPD
jgi:hypothetical protein